MRSPFGIFCQEPNKNTHKLYHIERYTCTVKHVLNVYIYTPNMVIQKFYLCVEVLYTCVNDYVSNMIMNKLFTSISHQFQKYTKLV